MPNFINKMPPDLRPGIQPNIKPKQSLGIQMQVMEPVKKRSVGKIIAWIIILIIAIIALVQYLNAAKYPALVQVIDQDRIGVNPTGNALDFGDLPRDKSAVRTVNLVSKGNTGSYIIVLKTGAVADLLTVDKNYFTLKPHTTEQLQFTAYIPNSAAYKYYRGEVLIFQIPKIW